MGEILMMLNNNTVLDDNKAERLYKAVKGLNLNTNEISNVFYILSNSINTYKNIHNIDEWDKIIKIRDDLFGTDEEKAIFMVGYMLHVFLNEIDNNRN
jgi:hypothetical protein